MMRVPSISGLRLTDITAHAIFGPLQDPVKMDTGEWTDPISYFADGRLRPMVNLGVKRGELDKRDVELTERVIEALPDLMGRAAADKPARIHGDLWSGNVMWTADSGQSEAVLIDPAAHGGHREEDLAMLHLFGMSYLSEITEGYQSVHPLKAGWQERITLWQLYPHRRPLRLLRRRLRQRIPLHVPLPAEVTDLAPLSEGSQERIHSQLSASFNLLKNHHSQEWRDSNVFKGFRRASKRFCPHFAHILPRPSPPARRHRAYGPRP